MKREKATDEIGRQLVQVPVIQHSNSCLMTESEEWHNTRLSLLNAVLDTLIPGARFVCVIMPGGSILDIYLSDCPEDMHDRPRDIVHSLRDLASSIEQIVLAKKGEQNAIS